MSNKKQSSFQSIFAGLAIFICLAAGLIIYYQVLGSPSNFEGGDPVKGHPKNFMGNMSKGGPIVGVLIGIALIIVTFCVERFITINKSKGAGKLEDFVHEVKAKLAAGEIDAALALCDKQKGSLANVVKAGLEKYKHVQNDSSLDKEQKIAGITKELEEATALELPMLSKNLVILSTCASLGTLVGLIGTVSGMISSFNAMATAGQPDPVALSAGISEALYNTLLGIGSSAVAIVMYNFFSTSIDNMTHSMDEASFTIANEYSASGK